MLRESAPAGLNDNHRRRIFATCKHIDKLLTGIEAIVSAVPPEDGGPLFHRHAQTLPAEARAEVFAWIAEFRALIQSVLARHRMALPAPIDDQAFAVSSSLGFMDLDLEELRPEHMQGYGVLDATAAADLDAIVAEFRAHIGVLAPRLPRRT
jgi:hypothetical protein